MRLMLLGAGRQVARQFLTLTAASLHRYLQTLRMASASFLTPEQADNATIGHGLNKVPELIIVKKIGSNDDWFVYTNLLQTISYNSNYGAPQASSHFRHEPYIFSVFSRRQCSDVNANNSNFVAYCFANVPGYQRIGSYTGNGSSTGPVIVTGFQAQICWLRKQHIRKMVGYMYDSERDPIQPC